MVKNITLKDVAKNIHKSYSTIRGYKKNNPDLLEVLKLGTFCKENNLDIEEVKKILEIKEYFHEKVMRKA